MYNKQTWLDEIPDMTRPIMDPSTGKQKVDPQTGRPLYELVQAGTRITSNRLNTIEDGIESAHTLVEQLAKEIGGNFVAVIDGVMGLTCSTEGLKATWTAGVAYVGGRRYEVSTGEMALNPTQGQYLYVDISGVVKKTTSQETAKAGLLLLYVATDTSGVITSTDQRVNISLDEILRKIENADIPDATLTIKGKVKLSNKTDGTSQTDAATEKAVNDARVAAINAAATDATSKANVAESNAKKYVNDNFRKPSEIINANLVKNSAGQMGLTYWNNVGGVSFTAYRNQTVGSFFAVDSAVADLQYAVLESESIGVSPNTNYLLQCVFHTSGVSNNAFVYIEIKNSATGNIIGVLNADPNKWWHRKTTLTTIPAGVTAINLRLVVSNANYATKGFSRIGFTEAGFDVPYSMDRDNFALWEQTELVKQSGVDAKNGIVGAINAKGGSASTSDTWPTLATKINSIEKSQYQVVSTTLQNETITSVPASSSDYLFRTLATFAVGTKTISITPEVLTSGGSGMFTHRTGGTSITARVALIDGKGVVWGLSPQTNFVRTISSLQIDLLSKSICVYSEGNYNQTTAATWAIFSQSMPVGFDRNTNLTLGFIVTNTLTNTSNVYTNFSWMRCLSC
ncbi:tail fiber protein [Paenibacillus illinoisensis]|uniref:tail fiber protein n=1 Tax=Paenibacillus illinoisensis TaxID=59845 RepID=UPI00301BC211